MQSILETLLLLPMAAEIPF